MRRFVAITGLAAAALLLCGLTLPAAAEDEGRNRVSFGVERERQVQNDRAHATLAITAEDEDAAKLAKQVNETMQWALGVARRAEGVTSRTGSYHTYPIQRKDKLRHWRASQELLLESGDTEALSVLVGKLQSRLQVSAMRFSVSPERRRAVEDELIDQVLEAAQARAERIRKGLGSGGYEWIHLRVGTGASVPPPYRARTEAFMAADKSVPPPAVEGGTSQVSVSASATIELD